LGIESRLQKADTIYTKLTTISEGSNEHKIVVLDNSGNLKFRTNLSLTGATGSPGAQGITGTQGTQGPTGATGTTELLGTQYVFVQANGTDIENAIELQAAYDLAITKIQTTQALSAPYDYVNQSTPTTLEIYDFYGTLPVLIQGQSYTFNVEGVDMIGEVVMGMDGFEYTVEFPTAFTYNEGDVRVYFSETTKSIVIAAPGNYNFENGNFIMDTEYVDLVSLDSNRSIVFNGANTIQITANNVFVKGVDVQDKEFKIGNDLSKLNAESCTGGNDSFGKGLIVSGIFTDCIGGEYSFGGGISGIASGTFINCTGGGYSFGNMASGTFTNCTGGGYSFGNIALGTFTNCEGGIFSFGSFGVASGTFTNCTGGGYSFGGFGVASGLFYSCVANEGFAGGGAGTASGTFTDCKGYSNGFGGNAGTASGTFTNCLGNFRSFGGNAGTASGTFTNCTSGPHSFGAPNATTGAQGVLSGKLYYCRLTSGTFTTKSGAGRVVLCIDGNNNQNNQ
jgi:hypothetical protein